MATKILTVTYNSVLKIQNDCNAFIGVIQVQAEPTKIISISDMSHPVLIPYNCCEAILEKNQVQGLTYNRLNITKNISWFTYLTITVIAIIAPQYVLNIMLARKEQGISYYATARMTFMDTSKMKASAKN